MEEQDPAPGEAIDELDSVTMTVLCEVPDVIYLDADTAASDLEGSGYEWSYDTTPYDPSACEVEYQDPDDEAEPGTEVVLELACDGDDY